jgi:hypothetical protein
MQSDRIRRAKPPYPSLCRAANQIPQTQLGPFEKSSGSFGFLRRQDGPMKKLGAPGPGAIRKKIPAEKTERRSQNQKTLAH